MPIATGVSKELRYKKETTWNTAAGTTGGQSLRRVTSDLNLVKDTFQSNEIRTDFQIVDFRHGTKRVEGTLNGELSLTTYQDFLAAALRKAWVSGSTSGALTDVTATVAAPNFVRASGSWITDGFRIGDVIRWTGWATATSNNAQNYRITALTATDMTVAEAVAAETSGASVTATVTGSRLWTPATGHTDDSFSIEHWHSDITESFLFTGCKVRQFDINLPATGMATCAIGVLGGGRTDGTSEYFTTPTAETSTAVLAGPQGTISINGTDSGVVTSFNISINGGHTTEAVIGSTTVPDIFEGRVVATGQLTAFFEDTTLTDAFLNETEISVQMLLTANNDANSDFISLFASRIKVGAATVDDGEKGLLVTSPFQILKENDAATSTEQTTLVIQDSTI